MGAISAPFSVFKRNIGQEEAFSRNPAANIMENKLKNVSKGAVQFSLWNPNTPVTTCAVIVIESQTLKSVIKG
jgi:hypothetical protein